MVYVLHTTTAIYAPWLESQDEPTLVDDYGTTETFDHLTEVAHYLEREGFAFPSADPVTSWRDWLSTETYIDPYTGEREERSAFHHYGFTDREWVAVVNAVRLA